MRRWLLGAAVAVGLLTPLALYAQSITYDNLSGNECWNAGQGPGGPASWLCSNTVRNSAAKVVGALSGTLTYGVGSLATLADGGNVLFSTQPVATTTLTAPANPVADGAIIGLCNVTGSAFGTTNVALVANTSQTLNTALSLNNLAAVTCAKYQFNRANTTWYRIQ